MSGTITVINTLDDVAIVQNTEVESEVFDLERYNTDGFFSLQIKLTLAGQVDVNYKISNNGDDFITPTGVSPLFNDFDVSSGPDGNGIDIVSFEAILSRYIKFVVTENNVGAVNVALNFAIQ